jgi:transmembrane sensor
MISHENHQAECLRKHVSTTWTPQRAQTVQQSLAKRLGKRRQQRRMLATASVCVLLGVAGVTINGHFQARTPSQVAVMPAPAVLPTTVSMSLSDGTRIVSLDEKIDVHHLVAELRQLPQLNRMRLLEGGARFEVPFVPVRQVVIDVGNVSIEVLGAVFSITNKEQAVDVSVESQSVRVSWPGGQKVVTAGDSFEVSPERSVIPSAPLKDSEPRRSHAWLGLANRGRFDEAFVSLEKDIAAQGSNAVPDEPGALLLAADAARLSRHPEKALPHLKRFVRRFPRDPRSSLAAFTLGLVLLEELGRPREAAQAFAQSRSFAPRGDLAEDALARQAEASFRAGDESTAKQVAQEYLRLFPSGRRTPAVRRFGAIE